MRNDDPVSDGSATSSVATASVSPSPTLVTSMVAGGRAQVGAPRARRSNLTGSAPRLALNALVPSAAMGGNTRAAYDVTSTVASDAAQSFARTVSAKTSGSLAQATTRYIPGAVPTGTTPLADTGAAAPAGRAGSGAVATRTSAGSRTASAERKNR